MANGNGLPAGTADAGAVELRGRDLRLYLDRLDEALDSSSIKATLRLMLSESAAAISYQESLIALEQLAGRDTRARMVRLRELRDAQSELTDAYACRVDVKDEYGAAESTAIGPLASSLKRLTLGVLKEREARGRAILWPPAQPSRTEPTLARHRAARRVLRSAG